MRLVLAGCLAATACAGGEFSSVAGNTGGGAGEDASSALHDSGAGSTRSDASNSVVADAEAGEGTRDAGDGDACEDQEAGPPEAGPTEAGPLTSVCPPEPPDDSIPCRNGLTCSYGDDMRTGCRALYECTGGVWSATVPKCEETSRCSLLTVLPVVGNACGELGRWCTMDSGSICGCVPCQGFGCLFPYEWSCEPLTSNDCPSVPPNAGASCEGEASCTYGFCPLDLHTVAECSKGSWSWREPSCDAASQ